MQVDKFMTSKQRYECSMDKDLAKFISKATVMYNRAILKSAHFLEFLVNR